MSDDGKIYGRRLSDSESDYLNYQEGVSPKELEETCKMLVDKFKLKHLSAHSLKEITAALEKVKNFCPFCQKELEFFMTLDNRLIYFCKICKELLYKDIEEQNNG